jgi:DNA-binding NarL/FixJ family response regulator
MTGNPNIESCGCSLAGGASTEVAKEMDLQPATVRAYRARVPRKLGLHNDAELMQYALRHELVE